MRFVSRYRGGIEPAQQPSNQFFTPRVSLFPPPLLTHDRWVALFFAWHPDSALVIIRKPLFPLALYPQQAILCCQEWSRRVGIPCDGVVLADTLAPAYTTPDRMWKLKDIPVRRNPKKTGMSLGLFPFQTIDYSLCGVPGHHCLFELMLRGSDGVLQSLHAFHHKSDENDDPYQLPVLLQGNNLHSGPVRLHMHS